jgi:hypothetical protein
MVRNGSIMWNSKGPVIFKCDVLIGEHDCGSVKELMCRQEKKTISMTRLIILCYRVVAIPLELKTSIAPTIPLHLDRYD